MDSSNHGYRVSLTWTGNTGAGTRDRRAYRRTHDVTAVGKPAIAGSSDPAFRGDRDRWNPEELLVVSLAQCHLLWYLDLAARNGIVAQRLHDAVDELCFIARSVNFPVRHQPTTAVAG